MDSETEQLRRRVAELEGQIERLRSEAKRFSEMWVKLSHRSTSLANLYVASQRLAGTVNQSEVLAAIEDVAANLLGSEEMAIFRLGEGASALTLLASRGIEPAHHQSISVGNGPIGTCAATGQMFVAPDGVLGDAGVTVCAPMKLDGKVTGVIALFRLLPHKARFDAVDRELMELLASHAATALHPADDGKAA